MTVDRGTAAAIVAMPARPITPMLDRMKYDATNNCHTDTVGVSGDFRTNGRAPLQAPTHLDPAPNKAEPHVNQHLRSQTRR